MTQMGKDSKSQINAWSTAFQREISRIYTVYNTDFQDVVLILNLAP